MSDIVADRPVPPGLKVNVHLWGECISGALSEDEFVAEVEGAGFYGVSLMKKQFWREVEGCGFYSVTVRGYKFRKRAGCVFQGHRAVYLGPYVSEGSPLPTGSGGGGVHRHARQADERTVPWRFCDPRARSRCHRRRGRRLLRERRWVVLTHVERTTASEAFPRASQVGQRTG